MIRLLLLTSCLSCSLVVALDDSDTHEHWDAFKEMYNKTYDSPKEEEKARDNFEDRMLDVALHNMKDEHDYDKGLNEYSDMSPKEMTEALCRTKIPDDLETRSFEDFSISERSVPSAVDWTKAGKVTRVKRQATYTDCGSCWSFSAAQAVEGAYAIKHNKLVEFSEQQLVDCAGGIYGNKGCNGGWPQDGLAYIKNEGGIVSEQCYPYQERNEQCYIYDDCIRYKITGYQNVGPFGDEEAVRNAVAAHGPLTAAIFASQDFQDFKGNGIYTDPTFRGEDVNHGVLITGYGSENGKDYWIIKNSWGKSWGDNGYIKLIRNFGNHLHIASFTSYVIAA